MLSGCRISPEAKQMKKCVHVPRVCTTWPLVSTESTPDLYQRQPTPPPLPCMSILMPVPAFWTLFVFAICARILLMYIRASWDDSPNISNTPFAYSNEVYASISRPLRLLRSIGSSLISTPGPIGLEFLCPGKTCSQRVSRLHR